MTQTMNALTGEQLSTIMPDGYAVTECGKMISRTYANPSYVKAMAFVQAIGEYAESTDHHPELHITWPETTVTWWTHTANGITQKDVDAAMQVNELFSELG
jgi:4a-hydroxytetrahydrobiopterin dehydratase